jgi:general secretion pathway protein E
MKPTLTEPVPQPLASIGSLALEALILAHRLVILDAQKSGFHLATPEGFPEAIKEEILFWSSFPIHFEAYPHETFEAMWASQCRVWDEAPLAHHALDQPFSKDHFPLKSWWISLLNEAKALGASDIHLELSSDRFQIRMRSKGALKALPQLPRQAGPYILNAIKHLAELDATEHLIPQDGRFFYPLEGQSIDFRVSVLPTHSGESVVLRLLNGTSYADSLQALGFSPQEEAFALEQLESPQGLLLVTGATGSGKTTTLYAFLKQLMDKNLKIFTLEDPIEYPLSGVTQVAIRNDIGLSFAKGLRAALRQDPDVLLVGEIRDAETARLAVEAALTGHLVLSSLHASTPHHGILRLLEWGVDGYALASVLKSLWGQQLLREPTPHGPRYQLLLDTLPMTPQRKAAIAQGQGA